MSNVQIDVALENGDFPTFYALYSQGVQPSLYAVQMAKINGVNFASDVRVRNSIGIEHVHRKWNKSIGGWEWDNVIPMSFRDGRK